MAERIIAKTTVYEAIPINEGLSLLLQNKREEYAGLEKEISSLLKNFQPNDLQDSQEDNQQIKITSEFRLLLKMHESLIRSAQKSIDIVIPTKISHLMLSNHRSFFKKAQKGVEIRIIIQRAEEKTRLIKPQTLSKNLSIKIKYSHNPDLFGMHIFDKKEATYQISERDNLPSLYSNDHNIVKLAEAYFQNTWNSAEVN